MSFHLSAATAALCQGILLMLSPSSAFMAIHTDTLSFSVNLDKPRYTVSEPYLSFNVDAASLYQFNEFGRLNFSDSEFRKLGKQFCTSSPGGAIMRIGGSAADDLVFLGDNSTTNYTQKIHVESAYWDSLMDFVEYTGCQLVWDLCALSMRRAEDNSWDPANAEALLDHIIANKHKVFAFQFGNEPGHW